MTDMLHVPAEFKGEAWALLERLFPIYRSIAGTGYRQSLEVIGETLPIQVLEIPSGHSCGSWAVPKEWDVREAYLVDPRGQRLADFRKNTFHICQYSRPFTGKLTLQALLEHVRTHPTLSDAVPLDVAFYRDYWGFCLSRRQKEALAEGEYEVVVDTTLYDGALRIGEFYLPGETHKEILLDAVLSCPSLANNLSGVVVALFVMKMLASKRNRHWSYRLLLTPETIGPIAMHFHFGSHLKNVVGGWTLVNLADRSDTFHYRRSRPGMTVADTAIAHTLRHSGWNYLLEDYDVKTGTCGNEKAYNSLGIEVAVGSLRRSHLGAYPEYDTSLDDLSFVSPDNLFESLRLAWGAVETLERNRVFKHTFEGEPFLTGYGLYPKIADEKRRLAWDYLMAFTTGQLSTVEIADRAGLPVTQLDEAVGSMVAAGLIEEIG